MTTNQSKEKRKRGRIHLSDDENSFINKVNYYFQHIDELSEDQREWTERIVGELKNIYQTRISRGKERSKFLYDVWEIYAKTNVSVNSAQKTVLTNLNNKLNEINDEIKELEVKSRSYTSYGEKITEAKKKKQILIEDIKLLKETNKDSIENWFKDAYQKTYAKDKENKKDNEKQKKQFLKGLNFEQLKVLTNESKYVLLTYRPTIKGTQVVRMVVREISQFLNVVSGVMETTEKIYQIDPFTDKQDDFYDMQDNLKEYFINKEDDSFSLNEKVIFKYIRNFDCLIEDNIYSSVGWVKSFKEIKENHDSITVEVQGQDIWDLIEEKNVEDKIVKLNIDKRLEYKTKIDPLIETEIRQQIEKSSSKPDDKFTKKFNMTRDECLYRRIRMHNWTPNIFEFFYNEFLSGKTIEKYVQTNYTTDDIIKDVDDTYECLIDFFGEERIKKPENHYVDETDYSDQQKILYSRLADVNDVTVFKTAYSVNDKELYYDYTLWNYDKDTWNDSEGRRYTLEENNRNINTFNPDYLELWNTLSDLKEFHEYYNSEEYSDLMDEAAVESDEYAERYENGKYLSEVLPGFGRIVYDALENGRCQHYIEYLTFLQMKINDLSIKYEDEETKEKLERYVGSINAIIFDIKQKQK